MIRKNEEEEGMGVDGGTSTHTHAHTSQSQSMQVLREPFFQSKVGVCEWKGMRMGGKSTGKEVEKEEEEREEEEGGQREFAPAGGALQGKPQGEPPVPRRDQKKDAFSVMALFIDRDLVVVDVLPCVVMI